jgi:hypothetical protein
MRLILKKKFILLFVILTITQSCSTAVTVVDTTTSVAINTVKGTAKGIYHITTCPFTKKECF